MSCHRISNNGSCKFQLKKVTHVIFDLDGTILNSEDAYEIAMRETCALYGKEYTQEVRMKHVGTPTDPTCLTVMESLEIDVSLEEFREKYIGLSHKLIGDSELMPGIEKLVKHLVDHNILIAIATSSEDVGFKIKFEKRQDFLSLFHHYVLASDPQVKDGKPSPDIYLVCADRFPDKPKPYQCLVIEDSTNGVKAAISAGMQCLMVPSSSLPKHMCRDATLVLNSAEDFQPELFGLPPYD